MVFPFMAAAILGSAVVGGIASSSAAKKAAKVSGAASDKSLDLQREQYERSRQDLAPYVQAGYRGVNALTSRLGIGSGSSGRTGQGGSTAEDSTSQYRAYFDANPDLGANADWMAQNVSDLTGDGQVDSADYGALHYQRHGQGEGRQLPAATPPPTAPPTTQGPDTGPGPEGVFGTRGVAPYQPRAAFQAPPRYEAPPPPQGFAARPPPPGYVPTRQAPPPYVNHLRR